MKLQEDAPALIDTLFGYIHWILIFMAGVCLIYVVMNLIIATRRVGRATSWPTGTSTINRRGPQPAGRRAAGVSAPSGHGELDDAVDSLDSAGDGGGDE